MKRTEWLLPPIQLFGYWLNQTNRRDHRLKTCTYLLQASTDVHLHHFQISSPSFICNLFRRLSQKNLKRFLVRKNYWVEQPGSFSNDMNEMIKKKHYWKIPAHFDMTKYIDVVFLRSLISVPYWKFSFWKEKKLQFLIEPPRKFNSN